MGLEVVTNEIKMMGDKEANKIKIDAENKAKTIIADATKQATEITEIAKRESKSQKERIVIREVSAANLIVKRDLLNAQKELLDKLYSQTSK
ncbi:MAG TPA: V-type ATP synthase subunit E, partial [Methanocorpusculum sp.]|nr:V-type ATP synthase subunit E [Methanocorpusculum sp.]